MPKKIIIDHTKCTGCMICAQACSLVKTGSFNPAASRIRVVDWEDTGVTVPIVCHHCAEPVCLPACPENAISKNAQTGLVRIDPETCVSCAECRKACPYAGPVYSMPEKQVLLCDHCDGEPTCVIVCPTGALTFGEYKTGEAGQRLIAMNEARSTITVKEHRHE